MLLRMDESTRPSGRAGGAVCVCVRACACVHTHSEGSLGTEDKAK